MRQLNSWVTVRPTISIGTVHSETFLIASVRSRSSSLSVQPKTWNKVYKDRIEILDTYEMVFQSCRDAFERRDAGGLLRAFRLEVMKSLREHRRAGIGHLVGWKFEKQG